MSKLLNPKVWYLVGIGAAALTIDGVRRVVKRRREQEVMTGSENGGPSPATEASSIVVAEPVAITPVVEAVTAPVAVETRGETASVGGLSVADLTKIKGIGPTYARRLIEAGYNSFADLSDASADSLREITKAPPMANIDEWIAQARDLA